MSGAPPLRTAERVAVWDAALDAVRGVLRGQGLREVVTPVRLRAAAVEPYIEPIAAPPGFLATSPELPMKRLLCRGSGPIFQIAPCFRAAERGELHREEFHLVEWYRLEPDPAALHRDVERLVEAVFEAAAGALDGAPMPPPRRWIRVGVLELMERTLGVTLTGTEDAQSLRLALRDVSGPLGDPLPLPFDDRLADDPGARTLAAWTAFFSSWCDAKLDGWLLEQPGVGIHVVDFPAPLAAMAEVASEHGRVAVARRFESHVRGRELANGYRELRDPAVQRRRFQEVNALRRAQDLPELPLDEGFFADLRDPGLPACAGAALGLDRLVLLATGRRRLGDVIIELCASGSES